MSDFFFYSEPKAVTHTLCRGSLSESGVSRCVRVCIVCIVDPLVRLYHVQMYHNNIHVIHVHSIMCAHMV